MKQLKNISKKQLLWGIPLLAAAVAAVCTYYICQRTVTQEAQQQVTQVLHTPFSAEARIHLDQLEAVADINRTAENQLTVAVQEPAQLEGLSFSYCNDSTTVSYRGMKVDIEDDSLLARGMSAVLIRAINSAANETGVSVEKKGNKTLIKGENESGAFQMELNDETGTILSLSVPELDLEWEFENMVFDSKPTTDSLTE